MIGMHAKNLTDFVMNDGFKKSIQSHVSPQKN